MRTKIQISVIGTLMSIIFLTISAFGQQHQIKLTGVVIDSTSKEPLADISVSLNNDEKVFIGQMASQKDGSFQFSISPGNYRLTFTAIGYALHTIVVPITGTKPVHLGKIQLASANTTLATVKVSASKPLIKQEIDRLTYDLQADPERNSLNLLEMMRKVPMLSVDANDNLEMKGSSSYRILVNGKPSAMMDRNLREVLRSMPASTIQKIEVITTPPSKYDAEGLAGIINIITHKKLPSGYSGTINGNFTTPTGGPGGGASFSARSGKLAITAFGGGGIYNTPSTFNYNDRISAKSILNQQNEKQKDSRSGYFGTEISYEIDSLHLLSASFNLSGSQENGFGRQLSNSTGAFTQHYALESVAKGNGNSRDAALNYQIGSAQNKNRLFTFSYRYYAYGNHNQDLTVFTEQSDDVFTDFKQFNQGDALEHTVQLDYVTKVKKLGIEAGVKGIFRKNKSDFETLRRNAVLNEFETDLLSSNLYDNTQDVYAAYQSYQFPLGSFEFKAGMRLEYTRISADFKTNQTKIATHQLNLLPAVAISHRLNSSSTLNLGFTQRIQRPGIYQLNPFVNRSNPDVEISGNPNLRPVIANGMQLGYSLQKKFFLNLGLDFTFFNSLTNQVAVYDPSTNITRISYQNTGEARLMGANMNFNYPINKKLSFSSNAKFFHGRIHGAGNTISTSGTMYAVGLNGGYQFMEGWRASASFNYRSRSFTLQRETNAISSSSFGLSKAMLSSKLNLALSISNPFSKYRNNITLLNGPAFEQSSTELNYFRSFKLSLNYSFGKLSQSIKKASRTIRNDDVSN